MNTKNINACKEIHCWFYKCQEYLTIRHCQLLFYKSNQYSLKDLVKFDRISPFLFKYALWKFRQMNAHWSAFRINCIMRADNWNETEMDEIRASTSFWNERMMEAERVCCLLMYYNDDWISSFSSNCFSKLDWLNDVHKEIRFYWYI